MASTDKQYVSGVVQKVAGLDEDLKALMSLRVIWDMVAKRGVPESKKSDLRSIQLSLTKMSSNLSLLRRRLEQVVLPDGFSEQGINPNSITRIRASSMRITLNHLRPAVLSTHTNGQWWGQAGAGILPVCKSTKRVLLNLRSPHVNEPSTYGTWGGAIDSNEDAKKAALREFQEESDYNGPIQLHKAYVFKTNGFTYTNFIGVVPKEFVPKLDWESAGFVWVPLSEIPKPLHPGLERLLKDSSSKTLLRKVMASTARTTASRGTLYHMTHSRAATSILKNGWFALKPSDGTKEEEKLSAGTYYMSTARLMDNRYFRQGVWSTTVVFELDGNKLAQRYKVVPVDYWQMGPEAFEAEERVLSPRSRLPIKPWLRKIYTTAKNDRLPELQRAALKARIPLIVYEDSEALMKHDQRRIVKVPLQPLTNDGQSNRYESRGMSALRPWLILHEYRLPAGVKSDQVWSIIKKLPRQVQHVYKMFDYPHDLVRVFDADLHNSKGYNYGGRVPNREHLDLMVQILRKNRWTTKQFLDHLVDKWITQPRASSSKAQV